MQHLSELSASVGKVGPVSCGDPGGRAALARRSWRRPCAARRAGRTVAVAAAAPCRAAGSPHAARTWLGLGFGFGLGLGLAVHAAVIHAARAG